MNTLLWTLLTAVCWPVLRLLTALCPAPKETSVLVIQLGRLGDLLCTTPVIRAIKEAHPGWKVHVLCMRGSAQVLQGNPMVDGVWHFDATPRMALLAAMRRGRFTWVINCMPGAFSSMVGLWALAPGRVNTVSAVHGVLVRLLAFANTVNVPFAIRTSVFEHYMKLVAALGVPPVERRTDFFPSGADARAADAWLRDRGLAERSFVCINLTAGNGVKEWPRENFAALADRIVAERGLAVVFSTLDAEGAAAVQARMRRGDRAHYAQGFALGQSGALYARAAAFISVDTGPLYVAHAMGVPLVVILGPVHPAEHVPAPSATVAHVPPPAGCEPWVFVSLTPRTGTPEQLRCARDTSVDAVFAALAAVLPQSAPSAA